VLNSKYLLLLISLPWIICANQSAAGETAIKNGKEKEQPILLDEAFLTFLADTTVQQGETIDALDMINLEASKMTQTEKSNNNTKINDVLEIKKIDPSTRLSKHATTQNEILLKEKK
jgi:hypothetical protein